MVSEKVTARVAALEAGEDRHDVGGAVGGDAEMAAADDLRAGEQGLGLVGGGEEPGGDLGEVLAERRELDAAAAAVEEADAVQRLELAHLGGERGLAEPGVAGGLGEALGLGHEVEGAKEGDGHGLIIDQVYGRHVKGVLDTWMAGSVRSGLVQTMKVP